MNDLVLQSILLLDSLSLLMIFLMYITHIPAAKVLKAEALSLQNSSHPPRLGGLFPIKVERVADDYKRFLGPVDPV